MTKPSLSFEGRQQSLLGVASSLYDAVHDDAAWAGLADRLAGAFNAPSAAFHLRTQSGEVRLLDFTANLRINSDKEREEAAYWRKRDLWVQRALAQGGERVITGPELIPDDEFRHTDFYNEWCRQRDEFHLVGAVFRTEDGGLATFGIHRPMHSPDFDEEDRALGTVLLHHYRKALALRTRLQRSRIEQQAVHEALHRSQVGVIAVGADMQVLYACAEGERVLRQGDALQSIGGRLAARSRSAHDRLVACVRNVIAVAQGELASTTKAPDALAIERAQRLPLTVALSPLRPQGWGLAAPAALVFVRDPECQRPDAHVVRTLFGLTEAEATVAVLLAEGFSVAEVSSQLRVTLNTVRTHVKRALAKTGTNRQAQMVGLIQRSTATLRGGSPPQVLQ